MIKYDVGLLVVRLNHLERLENELTGAFRFPHGLGETSFPSDPKEKLSHHARQWIWAHIGPMSDEIEPLGLSACQLEIQYIWSNCHIWSAEIIAEGLKALRWKVEQELRGCYFNFMSDEDRKYFEKKDPFNIDNTFPSSAKELFEAAKCISFDMGTSAVFHCMRSIEPAIEALAKELGRNFSNQQWHNILEEIESAIKQIQEGKVRLGPDKNLKAEKLELFARAAWEIGYFKDGWRNYVSHNKRPYDKKEAQSLYEHCGTFLSILAEKLSE